MEREKLIKLIEQKELELKKLSNEISVLKMELQNNSQIVEMTIDDKLKIYADYFKGRDDIYPYLSNHSSSFPAKKPL